MGRETPDLRIYLMRSALFNASMFPTGMMVVNTGLMARVRNEAQLAAVLGHEAGHYYRKHSIERYRSLRNKTATMAWVGAIANWERVFIRSGHTAAVTGSMRPRASTPWSRCRCFK
jgi:predicted Zn-dependent protease